MDLPEWFWDKERSGKAGFLEDSAILVPCGGTHPFPRLPIRIQLDPGFSDLALVKKRSAKGTFLADSMILILLCSFTRIGGSDCRIQQISRDPPKWLWKRALWKGSLTHSDGFDYRILHYRILQGSSEMASICNNLVLLWSFTRFYGSDCRIQLSPGIFRTGFEKKSALEKRAWLGDSAIL